MPRIRKEGKGSVMTTLSLPEASRVLFVGIVATALLDVWALTLNRALGLPKTNWAHVGRWVAGLASGAMRHESIAAEPGVSYERAIGWSTHYLVGVVYAALYLVLSTVLSRTPDVYSATLFGAVTVAAPWLILQPGLGAGYFASRTPKPNRTRMLNLLSHLVFGIGLYLGWTLAAVID
jgi:hypothetical protein